MSPRLAGVETPQPGRQSRMASATTILAFIPMLTSSGRGSDVMGPIAIPSSGGMLVVLISVFVVPLLYCGIREVKFRLAAPPPEPTPQDAEDE